MSYHSSQDPEENLPDWLKDLRQRQRGEEEGDTVPSPSEPSPVQVPPEEEDEGEEPEWLLKIRRQEEEAAEKAPTNPSDTKPIETGTPAVPQEEPPTPPEEPPGETPVPDAEAEEEAPPPKSRPKLPTGELPAWLEDEDLVDQNTPEEDTSPTGIPAFAQSGIHPLSPGEMPGWLEALRPDASSQAGATAAGEEGSGPLAGLSDVLPAEPEISSFGYAVARSNQFEISEHQQRHASVLERLIASEGQTVIGRGHSSVLPLRVLRYAIGTLLLVATALPLLLGVGNASRPVLDAYPESAALYSAIDALPADSPVLVVFDVEPSLIGEVAAPATVVLDHLLQKQSRLVFLSTQPTGPALVENLLHTYLAAQPSVGTNDYLNLGFLSGGLAALRQFTVDPRAALPEVPSTGEDPWARQVLTDVHSLDDFGLVLVMVSDAESGRAWIEQSASSLSKGLLVVSSAQAAPVLRPYLQSHPATLRGLVAGLAGAAYYDRLRGSAGLGSIYWNAYSYALGAALLLILVGGLYGRTIQPAPQPPAAPDKEPEDVAGE